MIIYLLMYLVPIALIWGVIKASNNLFIDLYSDLNLPNYSEGKYLYIGIVPFVNILYAFLLVVLFLSSVVVRYFWK